MIRKAWTAFERIKRRRYIALLKKNGLRLGASSSVEDGFFFDPSHCYLISIGERCTLAPNVRLIAHDASMRRSLGVTRLAPIVIEDDCFIGDSCVVLPGVTIGRGSIIGAGAVVTRSIPPVSVAVGSPARVVGNADEYRSRQRELVAKSKIFSKNYWLGSASQEQINEVVESARTTTTFIS